MRVVGVGKLVEVFMRKRLEAIGGVLIGGSNPRQERREKE